MSDEQTGLYLDMPTLVFGTVVGVIIAWLSFMAFAKPVYEPTTIKELDIAIIKLAIGEARKHCRTIKARNFKIDASGLNVQAGCQR